MIILALDTSSRAASCALLAEGELLGEFFGNAGLTHSQTILPMVKTLLESVRIRIQDVDRFAVTNGPGSFTGLRIGLAAVKGMAMEPARPCAAVSTLEALAHNLRGFDGYVVPAMDARRAQVYTALFRGRGGRLARIREDEAVSVEELGGHLAALPGGAPVTLVGDGARLCLERLGGIVGTLRMAPAHLLHQRAASAALLAAELPEGRWQDAAELSPAYLRLPQAERELRKKQEGNRTW